MSKSFSKAFDMDKDVLFLFNSLAFFPLSLSVKKISTTHPHSTPRGEISQVNCVFVCSRLLCLVWSVADAWHLSTTLKLTETRLRMFVLCPEPRVTIRFFSFQQKLQDKCIELSTELVVKLSWIRYHLIKRLKFTDMISKVYRYDTEI